MPNDPNDTMSVFIPTNPDRIPDTKDLSELYCPICEPVVDMKRIVRPAPCKAHEDQFLKPSGAEDERVDQFYVGGTSESEGRANRMMAILLRGDDPYATEAPNLQTPGEA